MDQKHPTGGEKVIQCLEREGVEYIFSLSGGAAMPMFDALVDSKIKPLCLACLACWVICVCPYLP